MKVKFSLRFALITTAVISVVLVLIVAIARSGRESAKRVTCAANGKYLYFAVTRYIEKYAHHPPRAVTGSDGKPWHSWRVLLLEFTDPSIFQQYSFQEPWDGPNNRKLLPLIPSYYRCPLDERSDSFLTSYLAVPSSEDGSKEAWPWKIIEGREEIPWMAPFDSKDPIEAIKRRVKHERPTAVDENGINRPEW